MGESTEELGTLTEAQREIMEVVWQRGEATASQVREELQKNRPVARNTVQTMLTRLEQRGWLKHREESRTYWYSAVRPRVESLGAKVTQLVDRFFAGSAEEMFTALMEHRGLTPDEADRIRSMIDLAEAEMGSQPSNAATRSRRSPNQPKKGRNR